jgi:hypothetical protein
MPIDEMFIDPTSPAECAVLVAPPLTREAFESDVAAAQSHTPARQARGDYAFQLARKSQHDGNIERAWREDGAIVADLCNAVISDAKSVGIRVYETATAASLTDAIRSGARVIVLIAHWKGTRVTAADIRMEALDGLADISLARDAFECRVQDRIANFVRRTEGRIRPAVIADELSKLICSEAGYPVDERVLADLDTFMNSPERARAIGAIRDRIDAQFPDLLVAGNCLELRDGFHKPEAIASLFIPSWNGLVELCVCFSMVLALAIKQCRDDRRVITNEWAKDPERCLAELRETFLLLSSRRHNYAVLRGHVFSRYSAMLEQIG